MKLDDIGFLQAITVRGDLRGRGYRIGSGTGREGDVLAVRVTDPGGTTRLIDAEQKDHQVTAGTVLLGVLANRDSTTHASGVIPAGGLPIDEGTPLSWLGGQSGLIGEATWSPQPDNPFGSQAGGSVDALGLVLTAGGDPLNIAALAAAPTVTAANTPVLVVCGTAAEVGKTTLTCRLIGMLLQRGLSVVAIKPTGSGGIVDSLSHRQAGAVATYDVVDSGLPSSYTSAQRYREHADRCLLYAEQHQPDLVVCELGGDLVWGNNAEFLRQDGLAQRVAATLCIAGDATGALGAATFWRTSGLDPLPLTHAPTYLRNPFTFAQRLRSLLGEDTRLLDDTTDATLARLLDEAVGHLQPRRVDARRA